MVHQSVKLLAVIALALLLFGCTDKALQTTAKASADIAAANAALGNTVMSAQAVGAITADQARPILQVTLQIAQADQQVNSAISGVNALTAAQKTQISAIIQPIIQAVNGAVNQGVLPITNQSIKTSILASLTTIQAALTVIQGVL